MTRITRSWTTIAVCLAAIVLLLTTPAGRVRAQTPKATLIDPIAASAILTRGGPGSTYQIFCGLWRVDGGFESSIRIRNELVVAPIDVTPILFMADGAEYDLPTVHVATGGLAGVDVNQALAAAPASVGAHLSQLGSVELRYQYSSPGHLVGSVQMLNTPESLIFVTPFNGVDEMPASEHTLEGLWWRRDPGISGYVSFANVTENPAGVRVQAIDADGRPGPSVNLSLAPHATEMRNLEDLIGGVPGVRAQAGGLRVTYTAPMGGVMVTGGLVNEREGYSAAIPFVFHDNDPSQGAAAITYGSAGLMSGAPDPSMGFPKGTRFAPYAALRNTTTSRLSVSLSLTWMQTNGSPMTQPLGVTTLGPLQAEQVDMTAALARAGAGNLNGNLNLAVSFTGHAGDLIIATGSVDQTGSFVFEVEPQGVGKTNSKQAAYWTTRDGSDTMYTIWNPTTQAQDVVMTFHYGDGSGTYRLPLHFAANASMAIDMAALTRNQQPDEDGFVMTGSVGEGSAIIESAGGRRTPVTLVVSGGTFNVRTGTCGQICINCCGYTFSVTPGDFAIAVGESMACAFEGADCNGNVIDFGANWTTSDSSVMTVDSSGTVTGAGAGSATITGQITEPTDVFQGQICSTQNPVCPTGQPSANTNGTAAAPTSLRVVSEAYITPPPNGLLYDKHRVYQILDQNGNPMSGYAPTGLNVTESYSPNPASGNCSTSTIQTGGGRYADGQGTFPDDYTLGGTPPDPCTSTSTQRISVNGQQVATFTVTWTHSGVTIQ